MSKPQGPWLELVKGWWYVARRNAERKTERVSLRTQDAREAEARAPSAWADKEAAPWKPQNCKLFSRQRSGLGSVWCIVWPGKSTRALRSIRTADATFAHEVFEEWLSGAATTPFEFDVKYNPWRAWADKRLNVTRTNTNREVAITREDVLRIIKKQNFACAITGTELKPILRVGRQPFAPSIDRIDCTKGYVLGNVRITTYFVNMAMNEWGPGPIYDLMARPNVFQ